MRNIYCEAEVFYWMIALLLFDCLHLTQPKINQKYEKNYVYWTFPASFFIILFQYLYLLLLKMVLKNRLVDRILSLFSPYKGIRGIYANKLSLRIIKLNLYTKNTPSSCWKYKTLKILTSLIPQISQERPVIASTKLILPTWIVINTAPSSIYTIPTKNAEFAWSALKTLKMPSLHPVDAQAASSTSIRFALSPGLQDSSVSNPTKNRSPWRKKA